MNSFSFKKKKRLLCLRFNTFLVVNYTGEHEVAERLDVLLNDVIGYRVTSL